MSDFKPTPAQERLLRMTMMEKLPTFVVGIPISLNHRIQLTNKALERGKDAAAAIAPIMKRQSAALVEAEDIFGKERIDGFKNQCELRAIAAEDQVKLIRAQRDARVQ